MLFSNSPGQQQAGRGFQIFKSDGRVAAACQDIQGLHSHLCIWCDGSRTGSQVDGIDKRGKEIVQRTGGPETGSKG